MHSNKNGLGFLRIEAAIFLTVDTTSKILFPSTWNASMPYPIPLSINCLHLNCSILGVDNPQELFSTTKITGNPQTDATFNAS